ncbi:MAG: pitrilysin family protein, partial [Bacteroidota bacterium]
LQEAQAIKLANGLPLYYIASGQLPVIRVEIIFKSGAYYEQSNGQSFFAAKLLAEGTAELTSQQIASKFDYYGSFIEINPGLDHVSVVVYTLSKHLKPVMALLSDVLTNATFPEKELQIQKRIKKQSIKINLEKTSTVASRKIRESIFGNDHPYGKSLEESDVDLITRKSLQEYKNSRLFNHPTIIVSGGIEDHDLRVLDRYFSTLGFSQFEQSPKTVRKPKDDVEVIEKEGALQSSIRMARRSIPKDHEDYFGLVVLNEVFGGYFGSRLMKNIREDKGYTYGIHSSLVHLITDQMMMIGTDVNREFTQSTIDEINKEMEVLRNEPVSEGELSSVKNYMLGSFLSSINTPFSLADKFKGIHFQNLGYSFYDDYVDQIKAMDSDTLMTLANKYLNPKEFSAIVVGGY